MISALWPLPAAGNGVAAAAAKLTLETCRRTHISTPNHESVVIPYFSRVFEDIPRVVKVVREKGLLRLIIPDVLDTLDLLSNMVSQYQRVEQGKSCRLPSTRS